jgi:hypothetical protein
MGPNSDGSSVDPLIRESREGLAYDRWRLKLEIDS